MTGPDAQTPPEPAAPRRRWWDPLAPFVGPLVILVVLIAVGYAIRGFLSHVSYREVVAAIATIPLTRILLSLGAVALCFLALTGYDWSAMRYIGATLPYRTIAFGSFCGYAIGNTAGFTLVTGGSVRYRIYSAAGLTAGQIAIVTVFTMLTFGLGITLIGGLGLALQPELVSGSFSGSIAWLRALGIGIVLGCAALVAYSYRRQAPIRYKGLSLRLPSGPIMLGQVAISALDMSFAALSLYFLLPEEPGLTYLGFAVVYCAAMMAGVSSHVPGGVGVFEAVIIFALKEVVPLDQLAAALVLWRCLFYFVPLILAASALAAHEAWRARGMGGGAAVPAASLVPPIIAALAFGAGIALLITTATPTAKDHLAWVGMLLPLGVIEASHLISSVLGLVLLILAHGLYHRLNAAFWLTAACLVFGIAASLAKGYDVASAGFLTVVLGILLPCKAEFHRATSLLDQRPEPGWIAAMLIAVGGAFWLSDFAFRNLDYTEEQFFTFALRGEAPRAVRAGVAIAALSIVIGLFALLRPPRATPDPATAEERARAAQLARAGGRDLALDPQARVLFGPGERSALVFHVAGRVWTADGDPVGQSADWADLIWDFKERADRARARAACHGALRAAGLYAEAGLRPETLAQAAEALNARAERGA